MSSYKIPEEITKKVQAINSQNKNKNKLQEIYDALDNVSNKFSVSDSKVSVPQKVTLEKMEFTKPTNAEIKQNSENLLADYKNTSIQNINNEYKLKEDELFSNKQSLINSTENTKNQLNTYYDNAKANAESQALKRGLARSSIIINQLDAFDNEKIKDYKVLDEELSGQINAINFELNGLSSQKQAALNNFDVAYAVKLQEKINELTAELNKKEAEVIEYNNEISLQEAKFNKDVDELASELNKSNINEVYDLIDLYGKYGQNVVEKVKSDQLYNTAKQFLSGLTKEEISLVLQDEAFKQKVGSVYDKLVLEFS